jgi:hypothetical protein
MIIAMYGVGPLDIAIVLIVVAMGILLRRWLRARR